MNRGTYKLALNGDGTTRIVLLKYPRLNRIRKPSRHSSEFLQLSVVNHTYVLTFKET